jgi:hypothetical protein
VSTAQEIAADIAKELRENPGNWCKVTIARDEHGRTVDPLDEAACCWCLLGHFEKRLDGSWEPAITPFVRELERQRKIGSVALFNDAPSTGIDDVIALCDLVARS